MPQERSRTQSVQSGRAMWEVPWFSLPESFQSALWRDHEPEDNYYTNGVKRTAQGEAMMFHFQ